MTFRDPAYFFFAVLIIAVGVYYWLRRHKLHAYLQVASVKVFKKTSGTWKSSLIDLPQWLKLAALLLAVVALARPQTANTKIKKNIEGIDIVICLDVSDSMLIEDMKPLNRLEAAKETIKKFIEGRSSDRIGLVIFAGESFTLVPPTLDYPLVLQRVDEITTAANANIKDGTALGVAMANAAGRLKDSQAKSRVMIFMTDGENNSGTIDPETGLEIAKGYGIKVYSVGMGKDGPTKIPVYTKSIFGERIKTYQPFESTVNETLLARMASETGGKFFRASKENSLKEVFSEIDSLEKTKIDINKFTNFSEEYQSYLLLSVILYFIAQVLSMTILRRGP